MTPSEQIAVYVLIGVIFYLLFMVIYLLRKIQQKEELEVI